MKEEVVSYIQKMVDEIRSENGIINPIIRDDVFSVLQACECTVLYYPLDGEEDGGCDGCHLFKPVGDRIEQFVFINTNNTRERQAFSVAHELGHVWKVDVKVSEQFPDYELNDEDIINRFAAELLMPEKLFEDAMTYYLSKIGHVGSAIKTKDLLGLIVYLMNYFFVPFKAVAIRFVELEKLNAQYLEKLLEFKDSIIINEIITMNQYTRLNIVNKLKSMDNLQEYWEKSKKEELLNEKLLDKIQNWFGFKDIDENLDGEFTLEE